MKAQPPKYHYPNVFYPPKISLSNILCYTLYSVLLLLGVHDSVVFLLGYCVVPEWLEEKLQHWEDPIIKVTQKWFLNIFSLLLNRVITGMEQASAVE